MGSSLSSVRETKLADKKALEQLQEETFKLEEIGRLVLLDMKAKMQNSPVPGQLPIKSTIGWSEGVRCDVYEESLSEVSNIIDLFFDGNLKGGFKQLIKSSLSALLGSGSVSSTTATQYYVLIMNDAIVRVDVSFYMYRSKYEGICKLGRNLLVWLYSISTVATQTVKDDLPLITYLITQQTENAVLAPIRDDVTNRIELRKRLIEEKKEILNLVYDLYGIDRPKNFKQPTISLEEQVEINSKRGATGSQAAQSASPDADDTTLEAQSAVVLPPKGRNSGRAAISDISDQEVLLIKQASTLDLVTEPHKQSACGTESVNTSPEQSGAARLSWDAEKGFWAAGTVLKWYWTKLGGTKYVSKEDFENAVTEWNNALGGLVTFIEVDTYEACLFTVRNANSDEENKNVLAEAFFPVDTLNKCSSPQYLTIDNIKDVSKCKMIFHSGICKLKAKKGAVLHELGHILGFRHEHIWEQGRKTHWEKYGKAQLITTYDCFSIMHYTYISECIKEGKDAELSEQDKSQAEYFYTLVKEHKLPFEKTGNPTISARSGASAALALGHNKHEETNPDADL